MEAESKSSARHEVAGGTFLRGMERKLAEATAPQMEGVTARVVFRGTTGMSIWLILVLLVPLNILLLVIVPLTRRQGRAVIVTDRGVHIFHTGGWAGGKIKRKVATLSRPVEVELTRFGLKLGEERKIYAVGGTSGAMKEAAVLAQQPPG